MPKIVSVCGARPNFMKIAPLVRAFHTRGGIESILVHTGQHYDERMSRLFFDELNIPKPDLNLEVGSGSHAQQTAEIMKRFEPVLVEHQPDWVVVVGDVNSTIACGLVASKLGIGLAHVEAGLRSFDRSMPEEINRVLTDTISDLLFVTESSGLTNLLAEGVAREKIHFVGNVMIDTLLAHRERAEASTILDEHNLTPGRYAVVTLHRPSNVDDAAVFGSILDAFEELGGELDIVFPMHPRTRNNLATMGLESRVRGISKLRVLDPLGYLDFLKLMSQASVVLTDSGGMQEETTILGVPCLTLRHNTERPVTIECGTNRLVEPRKEAILEAYAEVKAHPPDTTRKPELWDGRAGERIAAILADARH